MLALCIQFGLQLGLVHINSRHCPPVCYKCISCARIFDLAVNQYLYSLGGSSYRGSGTATCSCTGSAVILRGCLLMLHHYRIGLSEADDMTGGIHLRHCNVIPVGRCDQTVGR
ncbi:hypothetical protein D3C75_977730 [compost metagenome]